LLLGGLLHPFFGGGGKSLLKSLLTERFFLQSDLRFGESRQNPVPVFGKLAAWRQGFGSHIRCQPLVANGDYFVAHTSRLHEVRNRFCQISSMSRPLV
jgi:hypothetical protein